MSKEELLEFDVERYLKTTFLRRDLIADMYRWDEVTRQKTSVDLDQFIFVLKNQGKLGSVQSVQKFADELQTALSNRYFADLTSLGDHLNKLLVSKSF